MFDTPLRPLKDQLFDPIARNVPSNVSPLQLTLLAFLCGAASCISAAWDKPSLAVTLWILNRGFDCLDGGVARLRSQQSDLGGFLDLLGDFIVYSAIPISCGLSTASRYQDTTASLWPAIAVVEATFHVNNFVLFYVGAIVEKRKGMAALADVTTQKRIMTEAKEKLKQLTSVAMKPALIEGVESAILFTIMLAYPAWTEWVCWVMAGLVSVGIVQRVIWVVHVLK